MARLIGLSILALAALALAVGCAHQSPKKEEPPAPTAVSSKSTVNKSAATETQPARDQSCGVVRVHFALDSAEIDPADKPKLEKSAQCLKQDQKLHVTIEGNADERGTEEYNLALGDKRANTVSVYLQRLGASPLQLRTVSYGKVNPECTEHDEACWAKNRRAAVKPEIPVATPKVDR